MSRPQEPDAPMPDVPTPDTEWNHAADGMPTDEQQAAIDRVPARPQAPELQGVDLPAPLDEHGREQTLEEIREELPDGARVVAIELAIRNVQHAPFVTLARLCRLAFEHGVAHAKGEALSGSEVLDEMNAWQPTYVHHEMANMYDEKVMRITLMVADEPMDPAVAAEIEAEREAARQSVETRGLIDSLLKPKRRKR